MFRTALQATLLVTVGLAIAGCNRVVDVDEDGFPEPVDCDDGNAAIHPGAIEVCDQIDNDCDGVVDTDVAEDVETGTFYADADDDGFGDPGQAVSACSAPPGFVEDDTDCDDARSDVFPGGVEVCDGVDNDCDPATVESGVTFVDALGDARDVTTTWAGPGPGDPDVLLLDESGTYYVCDGSWHVGLLVTADVDVVGVGGPERAVLMGEGEVHGIVATGPATANVRGVTLTGFVDSAERFPVAVGSALSAQDGARMEASDVVIAGNQAALGGAASAIDGAELVLRDAVFVANTGTDGGHLAVAASEATLTNVLFVDGTAVLGSAIELGASELFPGLSQLTCTDCAFTGNESTIAATVFVGAGGRGAFVGGWMDGNRSTFGSPQSGGFLVVGDETPATTAQLTLDEIYFGLNLGAGQALDVQTDSPTTTTQSYAYTDSVRSLVCDSDNGCR